MYYIAQSDDLASWQCWLQQGLDNAFQNVEMADPVNCIFGATSVETLQAAFRKGLVEMVMHVVIDNVLTKRLLGNALRCALTKPTDKALQYIPIHDVLQSDKQHFQISGAEYLGRVFLFVILGHYNAGWKILLSALNSSHKKRTALLIQHQNATSLNLPSRTFCMCLMQWLFVERLRNNSSWADHDAEVNKDIVSCSIANLMHLSN